MKKKTVTVRDKMQNGYRYERVAGVGRSFDPEFKPQLTPKQMLTLGVFCGKYMTDCRKEFPKSWFSGAKLAKDKRDCSLNYFGVDASQPLSVWKQKGWICEDDPRGWFQWYCRYYMGRRCRARTSGRSAAGRTSRVMSARCRRIASPATRIAGRVSVRRCCTGPMTAGKSESGFGDPVEQVRQAPSGTVICGLWVESIACAPAHFSCCARS